MNEPSLYEHRRDQTVEQYRFLYLPTFQHPVAIRIQRDSSQATLRVVRLSGAGGYEPGHIDYDRTITLSSGDWDKFIGLATRASFWSMATSEKYPGGYDGDQWVLEGQSRGRYHVVDRWTPEFETDQRKLESFIACCRYLLSLSKLDVHAE